MYVFRTVAAGTVSVIGSGTAGGPRANWYGVFAQLSWARARGHDWVQARFVDPGDPSRPFIRAKLTDNPYLDQESYRQSFGQLDPITWAQILDGDWAVRQGGSTFRREWFKIVDPRPDLRQQHPGNQPEAWSEP